MILEGEEGFIVQLSGTVEIGIQMFAWEKRRRRTNKAGNGVGLYCEQRGCGSALDFGTINGSRGCREMQLSY